MGNAAGSAEQPAGPTASPPKQPAVPKQPMPAAGELEERFTRVLNCMNLPPDKVQLLSQYDNEKKWELICDQVGAWKAQLPLLLLLGNPFLGMQERSLPAAQGLISTKVAGSPQRTLYSLERPDQKL